MTSFYGHVEASSGSDLAVSMMIITVIVSSVLVGLPSKSGRVM